MFAERRDAHRKSFIAAAAESLLRPDSAQSPDHLYAPPAVAAWRPFCRSTRGFSLSLFFARPFQSNSPSLLLNHGLELLSRPRDLMSAQILSAELTTLISESKRKLPEIRTVRRVGRGIIRMYADQLVQAAEKSLQDLKSLPVTSETQLSAGMFVMSANVLTSWPVWDH